MSISVKNLNKRFGALAAVDDVTFTAPEGALLALLGPSGSGKSTLLRIIAGLEPPDSGTVEIIGQDATGSSPRERNIGFVFQHYALFRHMNVHDNIAFGLSVRKAPIDRIESRVSELLHLVGLDGLGGRYPSQLSGGQRQRVALARALAPEPKLLLLDEPFGALDAKVREELREWIVRLHEEAHVTTLFVTHDQQEALEIASKVLVMNHGRIEQEGPPLEVFDRPATEFVAQFVGETNFIESTVSEPDLVVWGPLRFTVAGGKVGERVRIYFRPHDVYLSTHQETLQVPAKIVKVRFRGPFIEYAVDVGGDHHVLAHVPKGVGLASGFDVGRHVYLAITSYHVFRLDGNR
ncbi:MAG: ABC transporter ATP-binding protein [Elusimicrobia bacterium]|nr:ABC transporter ATP-binding protein [Elusimicrobiota bacterium]